MKIKFDDIERHVQNLPGIYKIYTKEGISLKVGIGKNLRRRLCDHRASRQSGLKLKLGSNFDNPNNVLSKKSILAKHLYFDNSITFNYDLKTQEGRRMFLLEQCYVVIEQTDTKEEARQLELEAEENGSFRYVGRVLNR